MDTTTVEYDESFLIIIAKLLTLNLFLNALPLIGFDYFLSAEGATVYHSIRG